MSRSILGMYYTSQHANCCIDQITKFEQRHSQVQLWRDHRLYICLVETLLLTLPDGGETLHAV